MNIPSNALQNTPDISILIVDDEGDIRTLLSRWMSRQGYTCQTAATGQEALDCVRAKPFSLVILDIKLPDMSGMDILATINAEHKGLPVIMATSMDNQIYMKQSYGSGAYGFISKPFGINEVTSSVTNALRRQELEEENRQYRQELELLVSQRTAEIEHHQENIQFALDELRRLMGEVTATNNLDVRFTNPHLKECYLIQNCQKEECPSYGKGPRRCWQDTGTFCGGEIQGCFTDKYENCSQCPVYQAAIPDYTYEIGETFNNMMNLLALNNQRLEASYGDLQKSHKQVLQQEKMASIGQLSAGIAHEINNPVGFVSSNLGSLHKYFTKLTDFIAIQSETLQAYEKGETPKININATKKKLKINFVIEDVGDLMQESLEGCNRIKSIVGDLKSFSRTDSDTPEMCDINESITKTLNVVWNELKYKAKVIKEFGELSKTTCYPRQLGQVFMNLLINASHAIEKNGTITIRTREEDGLIFVSISDTGCGIAKENIAKVFNAFFTTKPEGVGTGLGLGICKGILEKHKGTITVESTVGEGTTFTVQLPVTPSMP